MDFQTTLKEAEIFNASMIWELDPVTKEYMCSAERGTLIINLKLEACLIPFYGSYRAIQLGKYLSLESAKIAAETYYLHRLRNGTL